MKMSDKKTTRFNHKFWLTLRNIATILATVLFLISILFDHKSGLLKFIAYLCGMCAYLFEFTYLTKGFREKVPHDEMFMIYCFAPLYLLLGISYLLH